MQFQQPFDARTVEPASFAPPPPLADYHVRITESEGKATKDNTGGLLELWLEILDPGPQQGRKIRYGLNLYNVSQQAIDIAYRQLSALCHVTGQFNVTDSRQLHNIPFIATIGPQVNNPTYSNVFGVKDINGNVPGKSAAAPAPAAPPVTPAAAPAWAPPAAATATPAWTPPGAPAQPAAPAPPVWGQPAQPAAAPAAQAWAQGRPADKPPWA